MVSGIESFQKYFNAYKDQYVIIGGTACDILMAQVEEKFRATKDIDLVLIVEVLSNEFGKALWQYIEDAGYEHRNKSTGNLQFYRFYNPIRQGYPFMLEIFSNKPGFIQLPDNAY